MPEDMPTPRKSLKELEKENKKIIRNKKLENDKVMKIEEGSD